MFLTFVLILATTPNADEMYVVTKPHSHLSLQFGWEKAPVQCSQPWLHIRITWIAVKNPNAQAILQIHYIKIFEGGTQAFLFFQVSHMVSICSRC